MIDNLVDGGITRPKIIRADLYILIKNFYFGKILIRKMQCKNTF